MKFSADRATALAFAIVTTIGVLKWIAVLAHVSPLAAQALVALSSPASEKAKPGANAGEHNAQAIEAPNQTPR